ncbi:lactonase family protein [Capnocytophaga stomatis]|uniref:lactonase family protein n=1 Tax=Capnocytophaga stomatis TaxID=1848904 RepID=UPI001AC59873|nr:lactonase family protein [Capnocytophaga stomatis]GIM49096.1 6-phosphogluconolactonase [Capnocytophaga stomatis]
MKKIFVIIALFFALISSAQNGKNIQFLVGTYTDSDSEGIYMYNFDKESFKFEKITSVFVKNPSYLTLSPDEKFLFSVSENDQNDSEVFSFSLDKKNGKIELISNQNTFGGAPCYVMYDSDNKNVMTSNYTGGNISVFPVTENGSLKKISQNIPFEKHSHLHSAQLSPDKKRILAADLGTDEIYSFQMKKGKLHRVLNEGIKLPKGTGPRHFAFSSDGKFLYVLGELSRKIFVFSCKNNKCAEIQLITTDDFHDGKGAADIHINPNGKFLYASNRLVNDGIAIFSIQKSGKLEKIGYEPTKKHPRNFAITSDGKYMFVASRDENSVQVFEIQKNGLLELKTELSIPKPVCIQFLK